MLTSQGVRVTARALANSLHVPSTACYTDRREIYRGFEGLMSNPFAKFPAQPRRRKGKKKGKKKK